MDPDPLSTTGPLLPASETDQVTVSRGHLNILVVEDEDALRHAVVKMLRKEGYSVISAGDGNSALDLVRRERHRIDVLLLDISLPGASSRDVFEEANRLIPGIKVIVATSYDKRKAATALAAEIEYFIQKPYRLGALLALLRESAT
jgi:CheY-like chemotaxis protein